MYFDPSSYIQLVFNWWFSIQHRKFKQTFLIKVYNEEITRLGFGPSLVGWLMLFLSTLSNPSISNKLNKETENLIEFLNSNSQN